MSAGSGPRTLLIPAHPGIQYHFARVGVPTYFLGHWDQFMYWRPRPANVHNLLPAFADEHLRYGEEDYLRLLRDGSCCDFPDDFDVAWLHFPWQAKLLRDETRLPKVYCAAKRDELSDDEWRELLQRPDYRVVAFYANTAAHLERLSGREVPYVPLGIDPAAYAGDDERRPFILTVIHSWARRGWNYERCVAATEGLPTRHVDHLDPRQPTLAYDELCELFRSAQVYLHDGEQEYTIALVEAMMAGLPIVTFELPWIERYVRHGQNGFVARSVSELREHCRALMADPALARELGAESRRLALEHFHEERWRREWTHLLEDAACATAA